MSGSLPVVIDKGSATHRVLIALGCVVLAVALWFAPTQLPGFRLDQVTLALIFALAIMGLNLLTGFTGQISLGHSAFFGLGAYTSGVLIDSHDWGYARTFPISIGLCFVVGVVSGLPALRIKGLYLALVTLSIAVVFPTILRRYDSITGGSSGLNVSRRAIRPPDWSNISSDDSEIWNYWLVVGVGAICFLLVRNLLRTRTGRAIIAVRDNEVAAATVGVNAAVFKTIVYGLSAALAGLAGSLYCIQTRALSPQSFELTLAIQLLTGMVLGGVATLAGPIIGGFMVVFVPYYVSDAAQRLERPQLSNVIFGVLLIVFMFVAPGGLVGLWRKLTAKLLRIVPVARRREPPTALDGTAAAVGRT
ncbi:MAG: branched-chain amino acid ABC transporter permease [Acidimicrobiia bacterium]